MLHSYTLRRGPKFALYAQALIFGIGHGELITALHASLLAWILGRMVLGGASLQAAFLAHAFSNLLAVYGSALYTSPESSTGPSDPAYAFIDFLILAFVLFTVARRWPIPYVSPREPGPVLSGSLVVTLVIGFLIALTFLFSP